MVFYCQSTGKAKVTLFAEVAHELKHPLPFREDDYLGVVFPAILEQLSQLAQLWAAAVFEIEDLIGVANHAHHCEFALKLLRSCFVIGRRIARLKSLVTCCSWTA